MSDQSKYRGNRISGTTTGRISSGVHPNFKNHFERRDRKVLTISNGLTDESVKKLNEAINKMTNPDCECGIDKTYGRLASYSMHSDYCPKSKIRKVKVLK